MSELRWGRHEVDKPRQASTSWGRVDGGIVGDIHPTHPKHSDSLEKLTKDHDPPRKDPGFYTPGAAMRDALVQTTFGGKDLGDGLAATAVEVVVWADPSGIVRAFRIAGTIYRVFFGSSKESSNRSLSGRIGPKRAEQDPAVNQRNMIYLSEDAMRSPREAAAEALRQHIAYLERKRKGSTYGQDDLRD